LCSDDHRPDVEIVSAIYNKATHKVRKLVVFSQVGSWRLSNKVGRNCEKIRTFSADFWRLFSVQLSLDSCVSRHVSLNREKIFVERTSSDRKKKFTYTPTWWNEKERRQG
jgi:hypothetical protein